MFAELKQIKQLDEDVYKTDHVALKWEKWKRKGFEFACDFQVHRLPKLDLRFHE